MVASGDLHFDGLADNHGRGTIVLGRVAEKSVVILCRHPNNKCFVSAGCGFWMGFRFHGRVLYNGYITVARK